MEIDDFQFDIEDIEQKLGYKFNKKELLITAFTHSTYANTKKLKNNQRLEFLGDSVLGLCVAEWLFLHSSEREGKLSTMRSHMVNEKNLYQIMNNLDVSNYMFVNKGKKDQELKTLPSVKADLFEAILGAIYLDSNYENAKNWVWCKLGLNNEDATVKIADLSVQDYKTILQEILQRNPKNICEYKVINEQGKPHERLYTIQIFINNKGGPVFTCLSKKEAEQQVAKQAIECIEKNKLEVLK